MMVRANRVKNFICCHDYVTAVVKDSNCLGSFSKPFTPVLKPTLFGFTKPSTTDTSLMGHVYDRHSFSTTWCFHSCWQKNPCLPTKQFPSDLDTGGGTIDHLYRTLASIVEGEKHWMFDDIYTGDIQQLGSLSTTIDEVMRERDYVQFGLALMSIDTSSMQPQEDASYFIETSRQLLIFLYSDLMPVNRFIELYCFDASTVEDNKFLKTTLKTVMSLTETNLMGLLHHKRFDNERMLHCLSGFCWRDEAKDRFSEEAETMIKTLFWNTNH